MMEDRAAIFRIFDQVGSDWFIFELFKNEFMWCTWPARNTHAAEALGWIDEAKQQQMIWKIEKTKLKCFPQSVEALALAPFDAIAWVESDRTACRQFVSAASTSAGTIQIKNFTSHFELMQQSLVEIQGTSKSVISM